MQKKTEEKTEGETGERQRDIYIMRIGPLLKKILEKQKENVNRATYECVNPSNYDAGEILAKKVIQKGLV